MSFPTSHSNRSPADKTTFVTDQENDDGDGASVNKHKRLSLKERIEKEKQRREANRLSAFEGPERLIDDYIHKITAAMPLELVEIERQGVQSSVLKDLARKMAIPISHMYKIVGVPKATAEKKMVAKEFISGSSGHAIVGIIKLLGIAQHMAENSTAAEASTFDTGKWLGQWIERPQPTLDGRKPAELLDTPTGVGIVTRLLGAIESGAYQ